MKTTPILIIIAAIIIAGSFVISRGNSDSDTVAPIQNVRIVDGKQIIEISARGGYQPRKSIAQAGIPTVIRFNTSGTFDCSSAVRIPSMGISKSLPLTGSTDIDIGSPQTATLKGTCGMGMYPFEVEFKS